jgi:Peptidase family M28
MKGRWRWLRPALVAVLVLSAFAYGASILRRPEALPKDAPAQEFSAERAMAHVRAIAKEPHPAGSAAMAQVATYLTIEMERLGLEVEPLVARDPQTGVTLHVVAARLRGRAPTGAVLFVAHPDSVPWGPGAGDNATGAATLLETARALTAGPLPRNDIIFLFDDGEELGDYRGGNMFAERHPWMSDVRLVVGLDTAAWGVPSLMEDSEHNGMLIRGYANGVDHPVALGLDASTNREDDAEIDPFRRLGLPGIELEDTYANIIQHTMGDTVARVNTGSLQLIGDQTLGVARTYSAIDLNDAAAPDRAFFTVPGIGLVHYPAAWGNALGILALLAVVVIILTARRRRGIRVRMLILGFAAAVGLVLTSTFLAIIAARLYERWYPDPRRYPLAEYLLPSSAPYAIVVLVLIAIIFGISYRWVARRAGGTELGLGFLVLWLAFATAGLAKAPVGVYLFQWPLLAACTAWLWVLHRAARDSLVLVVPGAIAASLLAPQLLLAYFGDGVAGLPDLILVGSLAVGLIAPALTGLPSEQPAPVPDLDSVEPAYRRP